MSPCRLQVLVTDNDHGSLEPEREVFAASGLAVDLLEGQCRNEDEVIAAGHDAQAFLVQYAPITRRALEACPKVLVVARYGVGVDSVDLAAATELGVAVANVPDYCVDEVSDHALALLLALSRKLIPQANACRAGTWDFRLAGPIHRLRGQKLGLVAFGRIARALAAKAQALGMEVLAYDPLVAPAEAAARQVTLVSLPELLAACDQVAVFAPLTPATYHLIGVAELRAMKKNACLVCVSRGGIVDEVALLRALREGWIAGAALDVREKEPPARSGLLELDSFVQTPHMAFYSEEALVQLKREVANEVVRVLQGGRPRSCVNGNVIVRDA